MAAFRDGHAHPLHAGINRTQVDLTAGAAVETWAAVHKSSAAINTDVKGFET